MLEFWPDMPQAWFIFMEIKFCVKNLSAEADKLDMLENPDTGTLYTMLQGRLLVAHEPPTLQRTELLHKMEPLETFRN
jgi:hypothetical protein